MAAEGQRRYTYQAGGSLPADAPSYVTRQADADLLKALLSGTYCYVLNARQMGKSSLRVRAVEQLFTAGVQCAEVELLGIGSQEITSNQWYGGIIQVLISSLGLRINRRKWLAEHEDLSPVQRLGTFVEDIVLPRKTQPLVVFFDEIDSVLGLNFPTDEFFGLVRSWYEKRAIIEAYKRLTVVMLGVATPSDLMQGSNSTPFNIGRAIELRGFSLEEARPLAAGLSAVPLNPEDVLKEILTWTGGQPFLTQKLCRLVSQELQPEQTVRELIIARVIDNWEAQDEPEHLRTVRNRLLRNARNPERLLELYQRILKRDAIPAENVSVQTELRLTGLVTRQQGQLKVFNQIYSTVFNESWVNTQLKRLSTGSARSVSPSLPWWIAAIAGVGSAVFILIVRSLGLLQPLELLAFDQLMRSRPFEPADDRFLIVTVSEADIQYQDRLGMERTGSLSDEALLKLWQKIAPYEPRVVGLDFYHPFPFSADLSEQLTQSDRFIAVCEIGQTLGTQEFVSIPPPPNVSENQIGFTDFAVDTDYHVRRHLLGMPSTESCNTSTAFSWQLALRYLAVEGKTFDDASPDLLRLDDVALPPITPTIGGYRLDPDNVKGYQILVNYRTQNPQGISLQDLLEGNLDGELESWVRDRIVLIGLNDAKDAHFTPVQRVNDSSRAADRMLGVTVHAHMSSQLISAVMDGRPLLWWLPDWGEGLWIIGWAVCGSSIVWKGLVWKRQQGKGQQGKGPRSFPGNRVVAVVLLVGNMATLSAAAYLVLLLGGWLPLVPPLIAMALASGSILVFFSLTRRWQA